MSPATGNLLSNIIFITKLSFLDIIKTLEQFIEINNSDKYIRQNKIIKIISKSTI